MSQNAVAAARGAEATPESVSADLSHRRRWWILLVISLSMLMGVLDGSIVNIALPSAQHDLGFSDADRQWVVTAYALAFGSLLLLGGRIADLAGQKVTFLVGLAGFAAASMVGGAANGFAMLVVARAVQGLFAALLAPSALSILMTTFTESRERAKAFTVAGSIAGAGGAIGLILGGVLTQYLDWRWTMYVNVVFAGVAFVGGAALLHRTPRDTSSRLDVLGTVLVSVGLFCLVYGFSNAETHGWGAPATWGMLAAGAVLVAGFVWWQTRAAYPLLPLRVLLDRNRGASFAALFVTGAGMFGVFLFLTYYLQQSLGYSALKTGFAFLPMIVASSSASAVANNVLVRRIGPKPVVPLGMAIAAAGLVWMTTLDLDSGYVAQVLPQLVLVGIGLGTVIAPAMSLATSGVAAADAGVASAAVNTVQQVGGSIGVALLSTMASDAATTYLSGRDPKEPGVLAQAGLEGYSTAYWWSAAVFVAGLVVTVLLYRRGVPRHDENASPVVHM
ncbi:EmrB/QacA subfamily drug resistance transporter [Streptomyces sp. Ag109_O5-1]|uniref:MFS transporter n=1 Tax=Streptomyces sp. Ag109_O5-1 TaxID=1938851 RepID=UPI000F50F4AD|nr:MFS transporter [Streptomyces sp. Ag109_O5-1]RPE37589.1 EmrB/QacA subfamily drug resistance transporter [Streptomyces sp. Ag109_O5-1]